MVFGISWQKVFWLVLPFMKKKITYKQLHPPLVEVNRQDYAMPMEDLGIA